MNLYKRLKRKARATRDRDVRIKIELFLLVLKLGSVSEACARRGLSRNFYYKWWNRFRNSNFKLKSLEEKSRRPKCSPKRISKEVEAKIHWYKKRSYGSRQIEALLKREGIRCSRKTICHVLNGRKKAKRNKRERLKLHRKRYELLIPGQRMQMDVKYVPYPVNGERAYSYVIVDECTRWRFAKTYNTLDEGTTLLFLDEFEKFCPFPIHTIQTDNGHEFTYKLNPVARHVEHGVDRWCRVRGIRHRLIPPGVKELNGKVERSHRIDAQYFYWKAPSHSLEAFNTAQRAWMRYYNSKRLHGGLGFITPLEKLQERAETLKNAKLGPELEDLRLKFLKAQSINAIRKTNSWRIVSLEQELTKLLKKIA